jgi:cytoskeletal protein CcmA (bactofilin family)
MFSKKPAQPLRPAQTGSSQAMKNSTFSILGSDVAIRGDISATVDLHIDGKVDGDIACAALVQGEGSEIFGTVKADSARLSGRLKGSISARELIILRTARIEGDVHYEALTIEQGAVVEGHFGLMGAKRSEEPHLKLAD